MAVERVNKLSGGAHALSDPIRLSILGLLARDGWCHVTALCNALDVAQSKVSFHLGVLSDAGLVASQREGKYRYYRVDAEAANELLDGLDSLLFPGGGAAGEQEDPPGHPVWMEAKS